MAFPPCTIFHKPYLKWNIVQYRAMYYQARCIVGTFSSRKLTEHWKQKKIRSLWPLWVGETPTHHIPTSMPNWTLQKTFFGKQKKIVPLKTYFFQLTIRGWAKFSFWTGCVGFLYVISKNEGKKVETTGHRTVHLIWETCSNHHRKKLWKLKSIFFQINVSLLVVEGALLHLREGLKNPSHRICPLSGYLTGMAMCHIFHMRTLPQI